MNVKIAARDLSRLVTVKGMKENVKMITKTKQKSWFRRHWILAIIICFFGVLFIAGIIGEIISKNTPKSGEISGERENKTETQTNFNVGEKITISNIEYTVTEAFSLPAIGSEYVNKVADGIFVILSITVKNNKNGEIFLTSNDFKLKDSQGRRYNADISAGIYLSTMGFNAFMFKKLGAGLETSGEVVFDVPEDDKGLVLEISGEGLFSDKMYVNIGDVSEL